MRKNTSLTNTNASQIPQFKYTVYTPILQGFWDLEIETLGQFTVWSWLIFAGCLSHTFVTSLVLNVSATLYYYAGMNIAFNRTDTARQRWRIAEPTFVAPEYCLNFDPNGDLCDSPCGTAMLINFLCEREMPWGHLWFLIPHPGSSLILKLQLDSLGENSRFHFYHRWMWTCCIRAYIKKQSQYLKGLWNVFEYSTTICTLSNPPKREQNTWIDQWVSKFWLDQRSRLI